MNDNSTYHKRITPDPDGGHTLWLDGDIAGWEKNETQARAALDNIVYRLQHSALIDQPAAPVCPREHRAAADSTPGLESLPCFGAVLQLHRRAAAFRAAGRLEEAAQLKDEALALVAGDFDRLLPEQVDAEALGPDYFAEPAVQSAA